MDTRTGEIFEPHTQEELERLQAQRKAALLPLNGAQVKKVKNMKSPEARAAYGKRKAKEILKRRKKKAAAKKQRQKAKK